MHISFIFATSHFNTMKLDLHKLVLPHFATISSGCLLCSVNKWHRRRWPTVVHSSTTTSSSLHRDTARRERFLPPTRSDSYDTISTLIGVNIVPSVLPGIPIDVLRRTTRHCYEQHLDGRAAAHPVHRRINRQRLDGRAAAHPVHRRINRRLTRHRL